MIVTLMLGIVFKLRSYRKPEHGESLDFDRIESGTGSIGSWGDIGSTIENLEKQQENVKKFDGTDKKLKRSSLQRLRDAKMQVVGGGRYAGRGDPRSMLPPVTGRAGPTRPARAAPRPPPKDYRRR